MAKSWSGTRKRLETDLLCEKLRGKIQYFYTEYHYLDKNWYGRFAIRYNGKEIFNSSNYNYNDYWREWVNAKETIVQEENETYSEWHQKVDEEALKNVNEKGLIPVNYFKKYFDEFFHTNIQDAINSENPVLRMLAVLDRRVGVRTLEKLALKIDEQPEWLKKFYQIRLEAEGIAFTQKNNK